MSLQFENIVALWGLVAVFLLGAVMLRNRFLRPASFSWRRLAIAMAGFGLCVVGLARPQLGHQVTQKRGMKGNLFIALDISRSMLAQDITPSRLGFAVAFATKMLQQLSGIKVAIFPFAMDGYMMMPLTTDMTVAIDMLSSLAPGMTTNQGTDITATLEQLFQQIMKMEDVARERGDDWAPSQVLLLSDGESHYPLKASAIDLYRSRRIPIFTVAVGTAAGASIPISSYARADGLRDPAGRNVITKANPELMQRISKLSGGDYFPPLLDEANRVVARITQTMQMGKLTSSFKVDMEYYPVLFLLALVLFAIEFGFGRWQYAIRSLLVLAILAGATPLKAEDEIKDPDRRAVELYNDALKQSGRNVNKAIELFQEAASLTKDKELKKKALYNLGNAYFRTMDPGQAVQAYQQARDIVSGRRKFDEDANQRISDNIALAVKLEEQMKQMAKDRQKQEGQGQGEDKQQANDPKGPQKDYQPQLFDEKQKQRMFDLMAGEEQQIMQRLMSEKSRRTQTRNSDKPW